MVDEAKSIFSSIGGVQALLIQVFHVALSSDIEHHWQSLGDKQIQDNVHQMQIDEMKTYIMILSLLSLLFSFVQDHSENAHEEMLHYDGMDIRLPLSSFLLQTKCLIVKEFSENDPTFD